MNPNTQNDFTAAVAVSRQWNAKKAGREVANKALQQLNGKPPTFVLLFATIHYEKHGGFQALLDGIWDILPKHTKLAGGTIPGFITAEGCYTRGATMMAVSHPHMDIALAAGHNTKREPKKAANDCSKSIKKQLKKSRYRNSYLLEVVSGATIPRIPGIPFKRVIRSGHIGRFMTIGSTLFTMFLQRGVGRESEILDQLIQDLPDFTMIGVSSIDDNNLISNYQFHNHQVLTNSIVAVAIKTNLNVGLNTTYGMHKSTVSFPVTSTGTFGCSIRKIEGRPATDEFLKRMGWIEADLDEKIYRRSLFVPIGYEKSNIFLGAVMAFFYGNDIVCTRDIHAGDVAVYNTSGRELIESVDNNLKEFEDQETVVSLIVACTARLETLGNHVFDIRKRLMSFFGSTPFLLVYAGGEQGYSPKKGGGHYSESFNVTTFSR